MYKRQLYNRFVESWQRVPDQTVKLCFHGTAEANIDAICRDGLDPKRRSGQAYGPGEYFGAAGNATISIAYCKGGRKMLVFAVLVDKSGLTCDNGQIIVVNKPEYQLPLFVLTFAAGGAAAGRSDTSTGGTPPLSPCCCSMLCEEILLADTAK